MSQFLIEARVSDLRKCGLSHAEAVAQALSEGIDSALSRSGPREGVNVGVACVTTPAPAGQPVAPLTGASTSKPSPLPTRSVRRSGRLASSLSAFPVPRSVSDFFLRSLQIVRAVPLLGALLPSLVVGICGSSRNRT